MVLTRAFAVLPPLGSERRAPLRRIETEEGEGASDFFWGGWLVGGSSSPSSPSSSVSTAIPPRSIPLFNRIPSSEGPPAGHQKEREKGFDPSSHPPPKKKNIPPKGDNGSGGGGGGGGGGFGRVRLAKEWGSDGRWVE